MRYELEKQLGIANALVADYEIKNRSLREIVDASERGKGEAEEQLSVKESVYEANLSRLEKSFNQRLADVEEKSVEAAQTYRVNLEKLTEELKQSDEYNRRLVEEKGDLVADVEKRIEASHTYRETLMKLTEELADCKQYGVNVLERMKQVDTSFTEVRGINERTIESLREKLASQAPVIQDLTDDLLRVNRDNGLLEVKLENTRHSDRSIDELENTVSKLEEENKALTLKLREVVEERTDLKSQINELRDRSRVTMKLEKVLDSFE